MPSEPHLCCNVISIFANDGSVGRSEGGTDYEHITDLRIKIYDSNQKTNVVVPTYGSTYTKILAKWTKNTGSCVIRNGMCTYSEVLLPYTPTDSLQ
jgi:hypothetical protein